MEVVLDPPRSTLVSEFTLQREVEKMSVSITPVRKDGYAFVSASGGLVYVKCVNGSHINPSLLMELFGVEPPPTNFQQLFFMPSRGNKSGDRVYPLLPLIRKGAKPAVIIKKGKAVAVATGSSITSLPQPQGADAPLTADHESLEMSVKMRHVSVSTLQVELLTLHDIMQSYMILSKYKRANDLNFILYVVETQGNELKKNGKQNYVRQVAKSVVLQTVYTPLYSVNSETDTVEMVKSDTPAVQYYPDYAYRIF